jgi:O-Antigen ligase
MLREASSDGRSGPVSQPGLSITWYRSAQRFQTTTLVLATIVACVAFAALTLALQFVSVVVLLTWLLVIAVAWRPRVGLYTAFGLVLMFEGGGDDDKLMLPGAYINGDLSTSIGLTGVIFSPLEVLLIMSFLLWLGRGIANRRLDFEGGRLQVQVYLFTAALLVGMVRGLAAGGPFNVALWESRFLFYAVICYVLATNTIRTRRHLATLIVIFLLANFAFAIEGAYRRVALIDTKIITSIPEFWYWHEDVIFLGSVILFVIAVFAYDGPRWQKLLGPLILGVAGYTLLASERRAGYIAVIVAFLAYAIVFLGSNRKAFFTLAVPILIGGAIYMPLFWNASGPLAQPARAVRSLKDPDPRDAASNLSRELEKINVAQTIHDNPLLGVGFGREFEQVVAVPDISFFVFWNVEPHHNVLWIWLKTGAIGFAVFLSLMGSALALGAHHVRRRSDPLLRTTALLGIAAVISTLVFSYVDLGLTSGRVTVFLGTCLGALAVLDRLRDSAPSDGGAAKGLRVL